MHKVSPYIESVGYSVSMLVSASRKERREERECHNRSWEHSVTSKRVDTIGESTGKEAHQHHVTHNIRDNIYEG